MYSKNFSETSQDSSCDVDVCEGVIWWEKSEWVCVCLGWVGGPAPVNGCLIKDWKSLWKEHIQLDINCVLCYSRIKWVNMYTRNKQKKFCSAQPMPWLNHATVCYEPWSVIGFPVYSEWCQEKRQCWRFSWHLSRPEKKNKFYKQSRNQSVLHCKFTPWHLAISSSFSE